MSDDDSLNLKWGVPAIAKALRRTTRAVYHMAEKLKDDPHAFPGLKKIGGKYCLNLDVFEGAMRGELDRSGSPTKGKEQR
jgi:hypothetical protein